MDQTKETCKTINFEELYELAQEMYAHLNWTGWGDSWERECGEDLRKKVSKIFDK